MSELALYTAVYPGVEPYLRDWYRSVREQTDRDFELWISLDGLSVEAAIAAIGSDPGARWVESLPGDTPADVRQRGLERAAEACSSLVLVDSDDILYPSRVQAAREALQETDVYACALQLVDQGGRELDQTMTLADGLAAEEVLPSGNVFGLSNTAYRSEILRRCLPIPSEAFAPDWYLASRAWLAGARMSFDRVPRMRYRRHGHNAVLVGPPYTAEQVRRDASRVLEHYRLVLMGDGGSQCFERREKLERAVREARSFFDAVVMSTDALATYVARLNQLDMETTWWGHVAAPPLRDMWA